MNLRLGIGVATGEGRSGHRKSLNIRLVSNCTLYSFGVYRVQSSDYSDLETFSGILSTRSTSSTTLVYQGFPVFFR